MIQDMMQSGFQSTLPVWGATAGGLLAQAVPAQFQSTLPVWGATVTAELGATG